MTYPDIIASIGVALLLIGFFLNLRKILSTDSVAYSILNILGAGLCGISSYMISFYPFVILESVWVVVAMVPLLKKMFHVKHALRSLRQAQWVKGIEPAEMQNAKVVNNCFIKILDVPRGT